MSSCSTCSARASVPLMKPSINCCCACAIELVLGGLRKACAEAVEAFAQFMTQPMGHRGIEAALRGVEQFGFAADIAHGAERQLARAGEAFFTGQGEHGLVQAVVEQRHAQFEPVGHGAEIALAQDVLGQVVVHVGLEQARKGSVASAGILSQYTAGTEASAGCRKRRSAGFMPEKRRA